MLQQKLLYILQYIHITFILSTFVCAGSSLVQDAFSSWFRMLSPVGSGCFLQLQRVGLLSSGDDGLLSAVAFLAVGLGL